MNIAAYEQWYLPRVIKNNKVDVLLWPSNTMAIRSPNVTNVAIVHDGLMFTGSYHNWYTAYVAWATNIALKRADVVVSPSEPGTAVRSRRCDGGKLLVVGHGAPNPDGNIDDPDGHDDQMEQPYFVHFAAEDRRKGTEVVLRACMLQPALRVAMLGMTEREAAEVFGPLAAASRVQWRGWVSEAEKAYMLRRAVGVLYISDAEGFGLPIVEAMASGCRPIVLARRPMIDVAGEVAVAIPGQSVEQVLLATVRAIREDTPAMRNKCQQRSRAYSWSYAARAIWEEGIMQ